MFEFIKWLLLIAVTAGTAKATDDLDKLDGESVYSWIAAGIAFIDMFVVIITGIFVFIASGNFPQDISVMMTIAIVIEFAYMLFIYGKVIPGYTNSGKAIPKTKDTIKIN